MEEEDELLDLALEGVSGSLSLELQLQEDRTVCFLGLPMGLSPLFLLYHFLLFLLLEGQEQPRVQDVLLWLPELCLEDRLCHSTRYSSLPLWSLC